MYVPFPDIIICARFYLYRQNVFRGGGGGRLKIGSSHWLEGWPLQQQSTRTSFAYALFTKYISLTFFDKICGGFRLWKPPDYCSSKWIISRVSAWAWPHVSEFEQWRTSPQAASMPRPATTLISLSVATNCLRRLLRPPTTSILSTGRCSSSECQSPLSLRSWCLSATLWRCVLSGSRRAFVSKPTL